MQPRHKESGLIKSASFMQQFKSENSSESVEDSIIVAENRSAKADSQNFARDAQEADQPDLNILQHIIQEDQKAEVRGQDEEAVVVPQQDERQEAEERNGQLEVGVRVL